MSCWKVCQLIKIGKEGGFKMQNTVIYDREARMIINKIKKLIKHYDIIKKGVRKGEQ